MESQVLDLLEMSSDILARLDSDGRLLFVNRAVETHLGYAPSHLLGHDILDWVHPEEQIFLLSQLRDPDPTGAPFSLRFRATSGHWVLFEVLVSKPSDGESEALLRARTVAAEERYRELFEESRDAIVIGTLEGRILDINPAGVRLFGFDDKEEMLQLDIARDLYWNPDDRKRTGALFRSQGYMQDTEIELRTKDGRKIRVIESASAVRDSRGNLLGFRGFLRDVTEHHRLQGQLRQSQKMEAVGRLAGGVAHDFNNLLTTINGYSELLLARLEESDPRKNALEEIRKAGKRATDLTRRLLTLSHHQVVSPRSISLNRAVLDMEKLLQRVLGEDILLRARLDPKLPSIFADQSQIEQVILNLAVNSRDAMPLGGSLELQTRALNIPDDLPAPAAGPKTGEVVMLKIQDTGRGMDNQTKDRAFEPFFTTKEHGHNTGLGLAIVYGIVTQTNGFIEVDSVQGKGTTFKIYFPVDSPRRDSVDPTGKAPHGTETILVVEDETSVRTLVSQILQLHGYQVLAAEDARSALQLCVDGHDDPDMVLTDVVMPGGNGPALVADLQGRYPHLKILYMSGYTENHSDIRRLHRDKAPFLAKPFSPDTLARRVRKVLDS